MEYPHLPFFHRPPSVTNFSVHPGNRHQSWIYTHPAPSRRLPDLQSSASIRVVRNKFHGPPQLHIILNEVKNLFGRQLPNMGTPYITRLVFDLTAETVVVFHNGTVSGAISSRLFSEQAFIEIVFLAVEMTLQDQGYGRLVMSYLKSVIQARNVYDMLTCADNDAVGYFKKQGFNSQAIRMDPERWVGYIKDYDGVTLMHCLIHPEIDYLTFSETVLPKQLKELERRTGLMISKPIKEFELDIPSLPHAVYHLSLPLPAILKRSAPRLKSPGITALVANYRETCAVTREKLYKILDILKADGKNSDIFLTPVTEEIATDYFSTIHSPINLWSIQNRLKRYEDYYKRPEIFAVDVHLMCDNAKLFNQQDSVYYKNAVDLYRKFKRLYMEEFPGASLPD
jgi:histone acetyltransferase